MMAFLQDDNIFEKISKGFGESVGGPFSVILLSLILFAFLVGGAFLIRFWVRQQSGTTSVVFKALCTGNGLTRTEIRALKRVAAAHELSDPAALFIRRSLFESGSDRIKLDAEVTKSLSAKLFH